MTTSKKLVIGGIVMSGVSIYMAYVGAAAGWQYCLTADECLADSDALVGERIRVSGEICPSSLVIAPRRMQAEFALEAGSGQLQVIYTGPLPDNLAERTDVVVEGRLDVGGVLRAEKVLTRCAGKYESQPSSLGTRRLDDPKAG